VFQIKLCFKRLPVVVDTGSNWVSAD